MDVTKAVIPVAGWGSRMLPITKSIEKCMLPIGNRPIVDYVVQDCLVAGITEVIFVVSDASQQIRSYFSQNVPLEDYLRSRDKLDLLKAIDLPIGVTFRFVVQPNDGRYGTAIPVALASEFVEAGESALVLMGDDFIYNADGTSEAKRLIEASRGAGAGVIGIEIDRSQVSRYGVIATDSKGHYQGIVEKPTPDEAPSNLINVSKYLLPKRAFELAVDIEENPTRGEYEITDVINKFVQQGNKIAVHKAVGRYLDGGNVDSWLEANQVVLSSRQNS